MADATSVMDSESTAVKIEQLREAFIELESHRNQSLHDKIQWENIREHFANLEKTLTEQLKELVEKEMTFKEKQSEDQILLAEKESTVAVEERAMLDRLQLLKDAAVSAIAEARKECKVNFPVPVDVGGSKETKVSTVSNGESNARNRAPERKFPDNRSGKSTAGGVSIQDIPRPHVMQLCEEMDVGGLLKFISENQKNHMSLRKELSMALKSAPDPASLVLGCLEGFYPPDHPTAQDDGKDAALQDLRRNCLLLMESAIPLLGINPDGDNPGNSEIKQKAKAVAYMWEPNLVAMDLDASNGYSLEAQAYLQLLVAFGIASDFDEDSLCKFLLAVSRRKQAPELCRSLGLAHKTPGMVEALVNCQRQLDAVHLIYAFKLSETFPVAPLLTTFLDDLRKRGLKTSMEISADGQDAKAQELSALRAVVRCIEENKLQDEYTLGSLQKRVSELKQSRIADGLPATGKIHSKKPRFSTASVPRRPSGAVAGRQYARPVVEDRALYGGVSERYPYAPPTYEAPGHVSYGQQAPHSLYGQQAPHSLYGQQASPALYGQQASPALYGQQASHALYGQQGAYNYPSERAPASSYSTTNYGSYVTPSSQPTTGDYTSSGYQTPQPHYQSAPTTYGSYTGVDLQPPRQPYM